MPAERLSVVMPTATGLSKAARYIAPGLVDRAASANASKFSKVELGLLCGCTATYCAFSLIKNCR